MNGECVRVWGLVVGCLLAVSQPSWAQASGRVVYEVGTFVTDAGSDEGSRRVGYGFDVEGSYGFFAGKRLGVVVGAEFRVRGFGVNIADRVELGVGVFDQSDLLMDQFVAVRLSRVLFGAYFEQRRIDRGTRLGTIGFPALGIGLIVQTPLARGDRSAAVVTYTDFRSGRLRLRGASTEPELTSGRSIRLILRHRFTDRWGVRGEASSLSAGGNTNLSST